MRGVAATHHQSVPTPLRCRTLLGLGEQKLDFCCDLLCCKVRCDAVFEVRDFWVGWTGGLCSDREITAASLGQFALRWCPQSERAIQNLQICDETIIMDLQWCFFCGKGAAVFGRLCQVKMFRYENHLGRWADSNAAEIFFRHPRAAEILVFLARIISS